MKLHSKEHGSGKGKTDIPDLICHSHVMSQGGLTQFCPVPRSVFLPLLQMLYVQSKTVF